MGTQPSAPFTTFLLYKLFKVSKHEHYSRIVNSFLSYHSSPVGKKSKKLLNFAWLFYLSISYYRTKELLSLTFTYEYVVFMFLGILFLEIYYHLFIALVRHNI